MGVYQDDVDDDDEDYDDDGDEAEEGYDENDRIEKDLLELLHMGNHSNNNDNDKRTRARLHKPMDMHSSRIKKQHLSNGPSQYVDTLLRGFEAATAPGLARPVSANAAIKIRKQQLQQQKSNHQNQNHRATTTPSSSNGYNLSERMQQVKVCLYRTTQPIRPPSKMSFLLPSDTPSDTPSNAHPLPNIPSHTPSDPPSNTPPPYPYPPSPGYLFGREPGVPRSAPADRQQPRRPRKTPSQHQQRVRPRQRAPPSGRDPLHQPQVTNPCRYALAHAILVTHLYLIA